MQRPLRSHWPYRLLQEICQRPSDLTDIYFSQFWRLSQDQDTSRFGIWWEFTSWFIDGCLLAVSSHRGKTLIPSKGPPPSRPTYLSEVPLPNIITLNVRFEHMNLGWRGRRGAQKLSVYRGPAWPWHAGPTQTRRVSPADVPAYAALSPGKKGPPSVWEVLLLLWDCFCLVESVALTFWQSNYIVTGEGLEIWMNLWWTPTQQNLR